MRDKKQSLHAALWLCNHNHSTAKIQSIKCKKNQPQTKQKQNRDMLEFIWSKGFPNLLEERLERRDFAGGVLIEDP